MSNIQSKHNIEDYLKSSLIDIPDKKYSQFKSVLLINEDRGRIQKFTQGDPQKISNYIIQTYKNFEAISEYVHQIQVIKDNTLWAPLFEKITKWTYGILRKNNFNSGISTEEKALECATDTSIKIINSHFPYDTNFDSWAYVITYHTCLRFFRNGAKITNPENAVILDEITANLISPTIQNQEINTALRLDLIAAIQLLKEERKQVILLSYFEQLPTEEIANKLSKSKGAIYNLKHSAIKDLQKILASYGNNN